MFYTDARTFGLPLAQNYANGAYTNGLAHGYTNGYSNAQIPQGMTAPYGTLPYGTLPYGNIPHGINFPIGFTQTLRPDVYPTPGIVASQELVGLHARIDEIRFQIDLLCNLVRQQQLAQVYGMNQVLAPTIGQAAFGQNSFGPSAYGQNLSADGNRTVRTRENDTHIILEVFLPHLAMGDVDVEISGNRIICRTRIPVNPAGRWWLNSQLPRGLELFELADGRVEFGWLVPVAFQAKEVEASWRDGFMCIYVQKSDATTTRQSVQVVRDGKGGRKTADMNS